MKINDLKYHLNKTVFVLEVTLSLALGGFLSAARAADQPALKTSQNAPAWELKNLDGKAVKSSDFAGKVVILNFWATWCPPCKREIPGFVELQNQYADKGLMVIGVSLDEGGVEGVRDFVKEHAINYPIVMGDEKITASFGVGEGIPASFIINLKGEIVGGHLGFTPKKVFEDEVVPLL